MTTAVMTDITVSAGHIIIMVIRVAAMVMVELII